MSHHRIYLLTLLLSATASTMALAGCGNATASSTTASEPLPKVIGNAAPPAELPVQAWRDYWYAGKAELTHYDLQMGRYSEVHPGDAALIFVAENMHKQKQVKTDNPDDPKTPVLKVNFNRKFWTGIYPYSMLTSINQPVDGSPALKVSASCEEWCGHTYMQLNRRGVGYEGQLHSYFPDEADQKLHTGADLLEDQMWTHIRINPETLPVGNMKLVPGSHFLRLMHQPVQSVPATAEVLNVEGNEWGPTPAKVWRVRYPSLDRSLEIYYESEFPWAILGWVEKYVSFNGKELTTTARRDHSMMLDYWNHNQLSDSTLRHQLGF